MSHLEQYQRGVYARTAIVFVGLASIGTSGIFIVGIGMIGRRLRKLADKARCVGEGDLSGPVDLPQHDELGELATVMNEMCAHLAEAQVKVQREQERRIEALEQLRHADRLRTVGKLAAGLAHELGTPLNTISMRATMILSDERVAPWCARNAESIAGQSKRMTQIIRQLLDYARPQRLQKHEVDLCGVIEQTMEFLRPLADRQHVVVHFECRVQQTKTGVDEGRMQQVLTNLLVNAIQSMSHGGVVSVELDQERRKPPIGHVAKLGDYLCISVRDEGAGIESDNLKHIFDPFFTTKDVGEGTGLGLSVAYGIVEEHAGWIDVESKVGQGSRFRVYLPRQVDCDYCSTNLVSR